MHDFPITIGLHKGSSLNPSNSEYILDEQTQSIEDHMLYYGVCILQMINAWSRIRFQRYGTKAVRLWE